MLISAGLQLLSSLLAAAAGGKAGQRATGHIVVRLQMVRCDSCPGHWLTRVQAAEAEALTQHVVDAQPASFASYSPRAVQELLMRRLRACLRLVPLLGTPAAVQQLQSTFPGRPPTACLHAAHASAWPMPAMPSARRARRHPWSSALPGCRAGQAAHCGRARPGHAGPGRDGAGQPDGLCRGCSGAAGCPGVPSAFLASVQHACALPTRPALFAVKAGGLVLSRNAGWANLACPRASSGGQLRRCWQSCTRPQSTRHRRADSPTSAWPRCRRAPASSGGAPALALLHG